MIIKETECHTKWCPFAYPVSYNGANRDSKKGPVAGSNCIGSMCMEWEYTDEPNLLGGCGLVTKGGARPGRPKNQKTTIE